MSKQIVETFESGGNQRAIGTVSGRDLSAMKRQLGEFERTLTMCARELAARAKASAPIAPAEEIVDARSSAPRIIQGIPCPPAVERMYPAISIEDLAPATAATVTANACAHAAKPLPTPDASSPAPPAGFADDAESVIKMLSSIMSQMMVVFGPHAAVSAESADASAPLVPAANHASDGNTPRASAISESRPSNPAIAELLASGSPAGTPPASPILARKPIFSRTLPDLPQIVIGKGAKKSRSHKKDSASVSARASQEYCSSPESEPRGTPSAPSSPGAATPSAPPASPSLCAAIAKSSSLPSFTQFAPPSDEAIRVAHDALDTMIKRASARDDAAGNGVAPAKPIELVVATEDELYCVRRFRAMVAEKQGALTKNFIQRFDKLCKKS